jgi:hypothetical protein
MEEIWNEARKDPSLVSNIDIDSLLTATENERNNFLLNKTVDGLYQDKYNVLTQHLSTFSSKSDIIQLCNKLHSYRYVDDIYQFDRGRHIRWIRKLTHPKLTNGATLMDIKFLDNGTHILCKTVQHRFLQLKFDDCLFFQKLSTDEEMILFAQDPTIYQTKPLS